MTKQVRISRQTRTNWLIDATLFLGAVSASLTGVYFLYFTSGGYQGGRNSLYGLTLLFPRDTWGNFHTWGGVLMIAAAAVHVAIHWEWVKIMARRYIKAILGHETRASKGAKVNVLVDLLIGLSFLLAAVSGIYFLFLTNGGYQGGRNPGWDPGFLLSRTTWDLIHTWSGTVMIMAAIVHFAIHWRWVVNVSKRFFLSLGRASGATA